MGFSPTLQLLSRFGIVLRELLGSTNQIRLRAEEMLIPDNTLGKRGSLLFQGHSLGSVGVGNGHLILRWVERGHVFNRRNRLCAACKGKQTQGEQKPPPDLVCVQLVHHILPARFSAWRRSWERSRKFGVLPWSASLVAEAWSNMRWVLTFGSRSEQFQWTS